MNLSTTLNKLNSINITGATILLIYSIVYAVVYIQSTPYVNLPVVIVILCLVLTYVFYTIVKCNSRFDLSTGAFSMILLMSIIPIIGCEFDPMGITTNYYHILCQILTFGSVYIIGFKIFQFICDIWGSR